jgi:hypothetical protein
VIEFETPYYSGKALSENRTLTALNQKSDIGHTHSIAELQGAVPSCSSNDSHPICWSGDFLRIGKAYFKPEPLSLGQTLHTELKSGVPLPYATPVGSWSKVATLDHQVENIFSINATLITSAGVESASNNAAIKLRVRGRDVEVWLASSLGENAKLNIKIEYTTAIIASARS